jgi:hypothetical protein
MKNKEEERIQIEERARFIRDLGFEIAKRLRDKTPVLNYIG